MMTFISTLVTLVFISCVFRRCSARSEKERVKEFYARNHSWPVKTFAPETPGWRKLFEHRLRQVAEIEDRDERFEGYAQTIGASVVQQNYTQWGFGLARAPEPLMEDLRQAIRDGVAAGPRLESHISAITEPRPWFIDRPDLTDRVLIELQQYPEQWVGFPLTANNAYGFRLYRNQSRLHVHVDKAATHVISFILHIDSSDDAEPWPILIEDYQGTTHEVILTSGDILFYESSKCFHGRPRNFNGSWYSSVFVHYYPTTGYQELGYGDSDNIDFAIPPGWDEEIDKAYEIPIQMHGTTMEEPWCPNHWCGTIKSKKWSGPGEEGWVIDPDGTRRVLDASKIERNKMKEHVGNADCKDDDENCAEWASWKSNECDTNSNFMKTTCKKSCGVCESHRRIRYEEL